MHSNAVRFCSSGWSDSEVLGLFDLLFWKLLVVVDECIDGDDGDDNDEGLSESGILNGDAATAALADSSDSKIAKSARPEFRNFSCRSYCWRVRCVLFGKKKKRRRCAFRGALLALRWLKDFQ